MVNLSKMPWAKLNRQQKELVLQAEMIEGLKDQYFFATKTSDRFAAGRPDLRVARLDVGQLDVELKYSLEEWLPGVEYDTGLTLLQWLKIKEMNAHGMPAIGLVYSEVLDLFFVTTLLRTKLPSTALHVTKLPKGTVIPGLELFNVARNFLNGGYIPDAR